MAYTGRGQRYGDSNSDTAALILWVVNVALAFGSTQINSTFEATNAELTEQLTAAQQVYEETETSIAEADDAIAELEARIAEMKR
ncbi:MAG: hypothetical protein II971_02620 [Firmicutes bacterium]|nr:hypothetical protein [Bacillota bacterium]